MSPAASLEPARARLKSAGLRLTPARIAILALLLERRDPVRVADIRRELGPARCDRVTVYRALAALAEAGLARRAFGPGGAGAYEADPGPAGRYRVLCRRTGRAEDLDPASAGALAQALRAAEDGLRARGYTEVSHRLEFSGVAPPPPPPQGA